MEDPNGTDTESVTDLLGEHHRRLDALLTATKRELAAGAVEAAAARFAEFRHGLDRHIAVEEEALFPVFERHTGVSDAGPTQVMRAEHAHIRLYLDEVSAALREAEPDCTDSLAALTALLAAHNGKEERILYPRMDRVLGDAPDRPEILDRIHAL